MFTVLIFMLLGALVGFLLRNKKMGFVSKVIIVLVWLLLFILGAELGNNPQVIGRLHDLGLEALVITIGAVVGSVLGAWALWSGVKKNRGEE